jgi:hypothetical protein
MSTYQKSNFNIPIRGNLTAIYTVSAILAVLIIAAFFIGLLYQTNIYPSEELRVSFLPTDIFVFTIGLPMLLGSMFLTLRGRLIGLLLWPGVLIFVLYINLPYIFAIPINAAFILHLTQVTLSLYALIGLLASIDGTAVRNKLAGEIYEHFSGGILVILGLLFLLRALGVLVGALNSQTPITESELALNISDYLIAPTWVICGMLLWKRHVFGYVAGLGLLFQASMLFIGLIISLLLQPLIIASDLPLLDIAIVFVMGLVCFVPFSLFLRGVVSDRNP